MSRQPTEEARQPVLEKDHVPSPQDRQPQVIPVIAEEVESHAMAEHTGTVRVRKIVREEAATVDATRFHERVEVVRVPVGRVVDKAEGAYHLGSTLVVPVYEERWVRQVVLVEELRIDKFRDVSQQSGIVPTRHEEVVVERFDPATSQWLPEPTGSSDG